MGCGLLPRSRHGVLHLLTLLLALILAGCQSLDARLPEVESGDEAAAAPVDSAESDPVSRPPASPSPQSPPRSSPQPEPEPEPEPRSLTVAATGDLLIHTPLMARAREYGAGAGMAYDFRSMFAEVRPRLESADIALCHLEVPLTSGPNLAGYPLFNAPAELADAIVDAGYDGCSTASNHSLDRGLEGVVATLDILDAAGLRSTGTARSQQERDRLTMYDAAGVKVAHMAATYGTNGIPIPDEAPWSVDLIDVPDLENRAAAARAEGAEVVIVSLHWGQEYSSSPNLEQRTLAEQLTASPDIDLLVGHHAHVVQPIERIGDKVVVFGLGNFLSNQHGGCCPAGTQDGMIVTVRLDEDREAERFVATEVIATPTFVERPSYRILPVLDVLSDTDLPAPARAELERSLGRTTSVVGDSVATFD